MQATDNIMMKYIKEIPDKLVKILQSKQVDHFLKNNKTKKYEKIIIIGSGSSYNAGIISKKIFEKYSKIKTDIFYPSTVNTTNFELYKPANTLVIGISQTGTSSSTINAIKKFGIKGFEILTITNQLKSPLAELGDESLELLVGEEDSNAKTKGFMNTVLILQLLAMNIALQYGIQTESIYQQFIEEIEDSIKEIPHTIQQAKEWMIKNVSKELLLYPSVIVGTEEYLGVIMEGATKLLETTGALSSYIDYSEFSHGMHRTVDTQENLYFILSDNKRNSLVKSVHYFDQKANSLCVLNITNNKERIESSINIQERVMTDSIYNLIIVFQVFSTLIPTLNGVDPNRDLNDDYAKLVSTRQNK